MRVALVYDRVNKFGGAERVLQSLHKIFPDAPIYTLVYNPISATWARDIKIIPSPINSISFFRNRHELLAPLSSTLFETFDLHDYDVVISVTSESAKAVITPPNVLHICYCLTPTRYFWGGKTKQTYREDWKMKLVPKPILKHLKEVDKVVAQRPDVYLCISKEVRRRIKIHYGRAAELIYPAINDYFINESVSDYSKRKYYLAVGRLIPYKKFDLVIEAFNQNGLPLKVVGDGSEKEFLQSKANSNIEFLRNIPDSDLKNIYAHAKALIFPQLEDFGLVPLEAQASGTPVIAYKAGGAKETVITKQTGLFFANQTVESLSKAIAKFEKGISTITSKACISNAKKFSQARFVRQFSAKVEALWKHYQQLADR